MSPDPQGLGIYGLLSERLGTYYIGIVLFKQLYNRVVLVGPSRKPVSLQYLCWSLMLWDRKLASIFCPKCSVLWKPIDSEGRELVCWVLFMVYDIKSHTFFLYLFLRRQYIPKCSNFYTKWPLWGHIFVSTFAPSTPHQTVGNMSYSSQYLSGSNMEFGCDL